MSQKDDQIEIKITQSLETRIAIIQKYYLHYKNNPFNKAYVHRLRVELRKLRALINFLKPLLNKKFYLHVNSILRDFGKKLSPLRDLDTLIEICANIAEEHPDLLDNYADIFSYLESERYDLANRGTEKEFISTFDAYLLESMKFLNILELDINKVSEKTYQKFIQRRYKRKAKKLKKQYEELDTTDYEKVHKIRKEAKKVRYSAVGFKDIIPAEERKSYKKKAKRIQEDLGDITDIHMSIELLEKYRELAKEENIKLSLDRLIKLQIEKTEEVNRE